MSTNSDKIYFEVNSTIETETEIEAFSPKTILSEKILLEVNCVSQKLIFISYESRRRSLLIVYIY